MTLKSSPAVKFAVGLFLAPALAAQLCLGWESRVWAPCAGLGTQPHDEESSLTTASCPQEVIELPSRRSTSSTGWVPPLSRPARDRSRRKSECAPAHALDEPHDRRSLRAKMGFPFASISGWPAWLLCLLTTW